MLRGLGTAIALPWLEGMAPVALGGVARKLSPKRMAFFYVPNGVHMPDWQPKTEGANFTLPATLEVLKPVQSELMVLSGLTCDKARSNGDGPGDHARAMAAFLTGVQPRKTNGADIAGGVSVDQVAAARIGRNTMFPSLEIGCEAGYQAGNCDSGYSCAYSSNISWRTPHSPLVKETNPRLLFERLFSSPAGGKQGVTTARQTDYRRSILDFVLEDATQLHARLGVSDHRKLDQYMYSIREIERRIMRSMRDSAAAGIEPPKGLAKPEETPKDYQEHIRLLADLLALAFQADLTRVATFVLANEGSNRNYRFIDVPDGHHDLSHHGGDDAKQAKIARINRFHMAQFAYFLEKLKSVQEDGHSLLDQSMILYGSGNGDGNRHNHDDLPILLVGKGGGTIKTGRHVKYGRETPLTNLYVSMLERVDVQVERLGDSTGKLTDL